MIDKKIIMRKKLAPLTEEERQTLLSAAKLLDRIEKNAPASYIEKSEDEYASSGITFFADYYESEYEYGTEESGDFLYMLSRGSQLLEELATLDHSIKYILF